ncbi:YgiQ family radical SAM protein [Candidatus Woesearchaeota archaeon]|nr:YgiQ family radical SAM protein [Candidatus Woesearchaeota archaeon]
MEYDIIFVTGEIFFDHPLCGVAILKRLLEKYGYKVGVIEMPKKEDDIKKLGKPKLFFGVTSGGIDSMVRNYTPLKKLRQDDEHLDYNESVPDRAVIVYSNWIKRHFHDSIIVLGGTEATLRRFVHYDYWDNKLRRPILFDSRANILVYGSGEKQILSIAERIKTNKELDNVPGTCVISKEKPSDFAELPNYQEVQASKEKFCDMQNMFSNDNNLAQKIDNRYALQYKSPIYTSKDLDEYYEFPFTRKIPVKHLRGFEFSVVTHRGCIADCNFCSLTLTQGRRIISRSEESILREIWRITKLKYFKGNIDDLGGPSANMYGMDCNKCNKDCMICKNLDRSNKRIISLLTKARKIKGVKNVYVRSGIRYDLASKEYLKELVNCHTYDTLRIAPEHVNKNILKLMNKEQGDLHRFIAEFKKFNPNKELSFYFMIAHPGSTMKEATELANAMRSLKNTEAAQLFTPTPMTVSTCMYHTSLDPKTKKQVYVPYTYNEKKMQKRLVLGVIKKKS